MHNELTYPVSQTEIPISGGTLDGLIDFDLCRGGTPFPSPSPDHAPRTSLENVDCASSIDIYRNFNYLVSTWPQFQVIADFVESVNGTASQNHPPRRSPDNGGGLNEVQTSDQCSGVPQNEPGLVNEEAIGENLKMVHYRPTTDNASSRVQESRRKKNVARIAKAKLGLNQVNLSLFPPEESVGLIV